MKLAKEQNLRLEQRRLYLEEQLMEHRHSKIAIVPPNSPRAIKRDEQSKPNITFENQEKTFSRRYRAGSAPVRRPKQTRLNRPTSAQKDSYIHPVYVSDLVVRSTTNQKVDEVRIIICCDYKIFLKFKQKFIPIILGFSNCS